MALGGNDFSVGQRVEERGAPSQLRRRKGTLTKVNREKREAEVSWDVPEGDALPAETRPFSSLLSSVSVVEGIVCKYGEVDLSFENIRVIGPPNHLDSLRHISLAGQAVSDVDPLEFGMYAQELRELDLSDTLIWSWEDVLGALEASPRLCALNLSRNPLVPATLASALGEGRGSFPSLKVLVLNDTGLGWEELNRVLPLFPGLEELYLSGNRLAALDLAPATLAALSRLTLLQLNSNRLRDPSEVLKLGRLGALETLFLASNPVGPLRVGGGEALFPALRRLALSRAELDLEDLACFEAFPALEDLKLTEVAAFQGLREEDRRSLMVACLPGIKVLNGGKVSAREREASERFFLRHFKAREGRRPEARFRALLQKHGQPCELAEVSLAPPSGHASVTLSCRAPMLSLPDFKVELRATVDQLRRHLAATLLPHEGLPSDWALFFLDAEVPSLGWEEMLFPDQPLYAYRIKDGDQIYLERRHLLAGMY